jgi:hypothetical protein
MPSLFTVFGGVRACQESDTLRIAAAATRAISYDPARIGEPAAELADR